MTAFRYKRISEVTGEVPLPPTVLGHIEKKTNDRARKESLAAYSLLYELACDEGVPALLSRLGFSDVGKPYDMSGELYVSLSHSGGYVAAAVADSPIGVDIERINDSVSAERLSERYLAKEEAEAILSLPEADRPEAFTRLFSEREAVAKRRDIPLAAALRFPREAIVESIVTRVFDGDGAGYIFTVALS